jgi:hypothetical protein
MHKTKRRVCFLDDAARFIKKNQIKIFGRFFEKAFDLRPLVEI